MDITRYELLQDQNQYTIVIYLDPQLTEFSKEHGDSQKNKTTLQVQIRELIKEKFPNVPISAAKVMVGTLLVTTIYIGPALTIASAQTAPTTTGQVSQYDVYRVQSGDSLSLIAKRFNVTVTSIKTLNGLKTDALYVGQLLKLPFFTYTVVSGDSLSVIAKRYTTTVDSIRALNQLKTDKLSIGQKLKIPVNTVQTAPVPPPPVATTSTYTVVAGDSLSLIAKKFGTTVEAIRTLNKLSTDMIFVGQVLKVPVTATPTNPVPTPSPVPVGETPTSYIVVSGDSLSLIAKKFNTTVDAIKTANLLTSDNIYVGQKLTIPTKPVIPVDTVAPVVPVFSPLSTITTKNQGSFSLSGTTEANATVRLTFVDSKNTPIAIQTKADATGKFTSTVDVSKLSDGTITVIATALDAAGNQSAESRINIKKDTVSLAPILLLSNEITQGNALSYPITGTAEAGSTVQLVLSDGIQPAVIKQAIANERGEFSTNANVSTFLDGTIMLTATAIDPSGNVSNDSHMTIIKDTTIAPPVIKSSEIINNQNVANYLLAGSARPGSTVDLILSDGINPDIKARAVANENGEYAVNVDVSSLRDTTLTISATQTSRSGNKSGITKITIIKDATAPAAPVLLVSGFINKSNQSSFNVTGTGETNSKIVVSFANIYGNPLEVTGTVDQNGEYRIPVDLSSLSDGDIRFVLSQVDAAGNISTTTTKTLVKDTSGPSNLNIGPLPIVYTGNVKEYKISGTTEPNIPISITITDGVTKLNRSITTDIYGSFSLTADLSDLKDGDVNVAFIATDAAGNTSDITPITLTKDTTIPTETALTVSPFVNSLNINKYSVTGTSEDEGAGVKIVISDETTNITKTAIVTNGKFSVDFELSSLKDGRLTVEMTQTDKAGNTGIVQGTTILKDTVVLTPTVSKNGFGFTNQRPTFTVIGTAEPNSQIKVTFMNALGNEVLSSVATVDQKGYYSHVVYLDELNMTSDLTAWVSQTDVAGNFSPGTKVILSSHKVLAGDSLYTIAKRYNTTVDALKALNQLPTDIIYPTQVLRLPVTASEVVNLGYMYFGNTKEYVNMVNRTANSVNTVAPSYFDVNTDGTLKLTSLVDPTFISTMHSRGIRVVPFLSNHWDRNVGRAMLANKELAAQQIADAIERYNLDGVNVDIENVTEVDRANYTEFVRLLRQKIPAHKEVSVAVAANPNGWTQGWHGSYDYTNLAKYADYLMIMSYDESYPGSVAGPVASVPWVEKSIQYAINQNVPRDKIVIGVAHYGRYWIEGLTYGGNGISNTQVENLITKYKGTVVFDSISKSPKAVFTIREGDPTTIVGGTALSPGTYTIWYENEESIRHKLALVGQYNIRGVGNWSIGQENIEVWNSYATSLPTTVPVTSVPYTEPVVVTYKTYTVVSGDSLSVIATRNGTTVTKIKELNNLTTDMIYVGQTLKIPTTTTTTEPVPVTNPVTSTITYTVVSGDSLSVIAKKNNTTITAIKQENNLTTDTIYIGQKLKITTTVTQ